MECFAAILLFDGFSERKRKPSIHWLVAACFTVLEATGLNLLDPGLASFGKILYVCATFFVLHCILYQSGFLFGLYMTTIYYATICCIDNLCSTLVFFLSGISTAIDLSDNVQVSIIIHIIEISLFYLHNRIRKSKVVGTTSWKWYTVPTLLSLISILHIFFFGDCFQKGQMSARPLFVCACFITFLQTAAMFLVSWMEQNAHYREETLSLQTKAQAQQESIEALSAAYAQQRKLTHDFQAHLDTLAGLLTQEPPDASAVQKYVHRQTAFCWSTRIMLRWMLCSTKRRLWPKTARSIFSFLSMIFPLLKSIWWTLPFSSATHWTMRLKRVKSCRMMTDEFSYKFCWKRMCCFMPSATARCR